MEALNNSTMRNAIDWKTTLPTVIGSIAALLGAFDVIPVEKVPLFNEALTGVGLGILTIIGIFQANSQK